MIANSIIVIIIINNNNNRSQRGMTNVWVALFCTAHHLDHDLSVRQLKHSHLVHLHCLPSSDCARLAWVGAIRRESTGGERGEVFSLAIKMQGTNRKWGGEARDFCVCDLGSELRLGGRDERKANTTYGIKIPSKHVYVPPCNSLCSILTGSGSSTT